MSVRSEKKLKAMQAWKPATPEGLDSMTVREWRQWRAGLLWHAQRLAAAGYYENKGPALASTLGIQRRVLLAMAEEGLVESCEAFMKANL